MGSLKSTGSTIALIGAVIALVLTVFELVGLTLQGLIGVSLDFNFGIGSSGTVLTLIFALVLFLITTGRISLTEPIILGIIVIIFGVLIGGIGGLLAIIGGALIILDILATNG